MRLRRVLLVAFLALAVPVAAASLAYACTALATMTITSGPVAPGQTVTGTGKGFNGGGHGTPAGSTPVFLRLDTRSGPVLATAVPLDAAGNIAFSFTAPNAPGPHVLIGVQTNPANGTPFYGTPARQSLTILAPARSTADRGQGTGASSTGSATDPQVPSAPAASGEPAAAGATAGAPAVAPASPSVQPVQAPGAAAPVQPAGAPAAATAAEAAVQANPSSASGTVDAGTGGGGQPPISPGVPGAAVGASSVASPAAVTTATPGLVPSSSGEPSSVLPALLLMLLGLGIGLAATARLVASRPQLRSGATAT